MMRQAVETALGQVLTDDQGWYTASAERWSATSGWAGDVPTYLKATANSKNVFTLTSHSGWVQERPVPRCNHSRSSPVSTAEA